MSLIHLNKSNINVYIWKTGKCPHLSILLKYSSCVYILQRAVVPFTSGSFFFFFAECEFSLFRPPLSYCWILFLGFLGLRSGCWSTLSAGVYLVIETEQPSALGPQVEKLTTSNSWHALPMSSPPTSDKGHSVHPFAPSWPPSAGSSVQLIYTLMSLQLPSPRSPLSLQTTCFHRSATILSCSRTLSSRCLKIRKDADQGRTIDRKCQRSKMEY